MRNRYCYWSFADGNYARLMENCIASARQAGVFKEFHILTDQPIQGAECYDSQQIEKADGLFKIIFLKVVSKLLFDYFIWIDADTWFVRAPRDMLGCMGSSPVHVPLLTCLSPGAEKIAECDYARLMVDAGVYNPVYLASSAFWIVHHDAIDCVFDLAVHFRAFAKKRGINIGATHALGYAMQMLCANPEAHRFSVRADLWAHDENDTFASRSPGGSPWYCRICQNDEAHKVNPAIIHVPHLKRRTAKDRQPVVGNSRGSVEQNHTGPVSTEDVVPVVGDDCIFDENTMKGLL